MTRFKKLSLILFFAIAGTCCSSQMVFAQDGNSDTQEVEAIDADSVFLVKDVDNQMDMAMNILKVSVRTVVQTEYPKVKRRDRKEGEIEVELYIDEMGYVYETKYLNSMGEPYDTEAKRVVELIKGDKFEPGLKGESKVKVKLTVLITFDPKSRNKRNKSINVEF